MDNLKNLAEMQPLAQALQKLPERVRERIAYLIEGALLIQDATELKEPEAKAG